MNIDFLFFSVLKGQPRVATFGTIFINLLIDPKNERNFFKFRGIGIDFLPRFYLPTELLLISIF